MFFKRKDVNLYYEREGHGPEVLLIHGAVADAGYFSKSRDILKRFFTVTTYDRRGNSRSSYEEGAAFDMEEQTDDAVALIEMLDLKDVVVVGHSAGGMIALETLKKVPSRIKHIFVYETPMLMLTKEYDPSIVDWVYHMDGINKAGEHKQVAKEFGLSIGLLDERAPKKSKEEKIKDRNNFGHFINHEFLPFSFYEPDMEFFKINASYITAMAGDRNYGSTYHKAMTEFSRISGCELLSTAGCHNYPYDLPKDFAVTVLGAIECIQ